MRADVETVTAWGDGVQPNSYFSPLHIWNVLRNSATDARLFVPALLALAIAYGAEIGSYTFSSDYFYENMNVGALVSGYSPDGRFLAEAIRYGLFDGFMVPSFLLILGVLTLAFVGILLCCIYGINGAAEKVIAVVLVGTFPFFYEVFSYVNMRHVVPLAVLLAVVGIMLLNWEGRRSLSVGGFALVYLSLFLYQSAVNFAAVVVLAWAAFHLVNGENLASTVKRVLAPKLAGVLAAMALYRISLYLLDKIFGISAVRLNNFSGLPSNFTEMLAALKINLIAVVSFFYEPWPFLPAGLKWMLAAALAASLGLIALHWRRRRLTALGALAAMHLVLLMPVAAHGVAWILYPPHGLIQARIFIAYASVTFGFFAFTLKLTSGRARRATLAAFACMAIAFVYQANVWHHYMSLRNLADFDMTRQISGRIKADLAYRDDLPMVVVGVSELDDYLVYRRLIFPPSKIGLSIIGSAYSKHWSKDRLLRFYVPFRNPTQSEITRAEAFAATRRPWPHPESVAIVDGVIVVVLDSPMAEERPARLSQNR